VKNIRCHIIIIGIQPLFRFGQRPELIQATGMALVRCILDKLLGVVCHCFPPRLDVPTFATRCLHVRHNARDPSGGRWNCGREFCPVILPKWRLPRHLIRCHIIIIGIQPLFRFRQRPGLIQATGMALVRCILNKFLGVVCHCFPLRLDVPTFATRCLHVRHNARDPSGGRWNCGRECCPVILPKWRLPRHLTFWSRKFYI